MTRNPFIPWGSEPEARISAPSSSHPWIHSQNTLNFAPRASQSSLNTHPELCLENIPRARHTPSIFPSESPRTKLAMLSNINTHTHTPNTARNRQQAKTKVTSKTNLQKNTTLGMSKHSINLVSVCTLWLGERNCSSSISTHSLLFFYFRTCIIFTEGKGW